MNRSVFSSLGSLAIASLLLGGLSACGTSSSPAPITLHLVSYDDEKSPGGDQIRHLSTELRKLSGGAMTIESVFLASDTEVGTAHLVTSGTDDLALIAARSWDQLGVKSLRALNTPFLVTNEALLDKVVDGSLRTKLLSGLPDAGVVGVDLFPEQFRHPFGYDAPLLGVEDYAGQDVRVPPSDTSNALFTALGAHPMMADEGLRGAESGYRLAPANIATGNVVFFPKVNALVINSKVKSKLSSAQWDDLSRAAAATRQWVIDTFPTDTQAAATFCQEGGEIVGATSAQLAALHAAVKPVIQELEQDPLTERLISAIGKLNEGTTAPEPTASCPASVEADEASTLNGTYRFTADPTAEAKAGISSSAVDENSGDFTMVLDDGQWTMDQVYASGPKTGTTYHATGAFVVSAGRMTWLWTHEDGNWTKAAVKIQPDRSLLFSDYEESPGTAQDSYLLDGFLFGTWTRTAD